MIAATNSTRAFYARAQLNMGGLRQASEQLQNQLATGERLSRSSDDPVAASRLRMLARMDQLGEVDAANARRTAEDLQLTGRALDSAAQDLIRARELALFAANGALGQAERALVAEELDQLRLNLLASANMQGSGGNALFGGEVSGAAYQIDASGNVIYIGSASTGTIDLGQGQFVERGLLGPPVFDLAGGDVFAHLAALAGALRGGSPDPAQSAADSLAGFDEAIDNVARAQTVTGARVAWLDVVQDRQLDQSLTRAQQSAETGGVDFASTVAELQQVLTVLEASQASFARVAQLTLFDRI